MTNIGFLKEEVEKAWAQIGEIVFEMEMASPEFIDFETYDLEREIALKKIDHILQWINQLNSIAYNLTKGRDERLVPELITFTGTVEEKYEALMRMRRKRLAQIGRYYVQLQNLDKFASYEEYMMTVRTKRNMRHEMQMLAELQGEIESFINYFDVRVTV